MSQHEHEQKAFMEVWRILLRYRWRFVVPAFAAIALALAGSLALPRKYEANATFERTTNMVIRQMHNRGATQAYEDPSRALALQIVGNTAITQLLNKLQPKLNKMGVLHNAHDRRELHIRIHRQTTLDREISSGQLDRLRLEYIGNDPRVVRMVANGLVQQYIDRQRKQMQQRLDQSSQFFRRQVEQSRKQAKALEAQLLTFEIKHAELLPHTPNNIQTQIASLSNQLQKLQAQDDGLTSQITSIKSDLASQPKTITRKVPTADPELQHLQIERGNLEDQLNDDLQIKKMRPTHPDVIDLKQRIAMIDTRIKKASATPIMVNKTIANPKRQVLKDRLEQAIGDRDALDRQIAAMRTDLGRKSKAASNLYSVRSQYQSLQRQVAEAQHQIDFWQDNLRRISLSSVAENDHRGVSLRFVRPASRIITPVSPKLPQVLLAAAVLGLLTGSICVFLAYRSDDTFLRGDVAAKAMDLPLIGAVSEVVTQRYQRLRMLRNTILYPVNAIAMAIVLAGLITIVYLNLQRPQVYAALRGRAASFIYHHDGDSASHH